MKLFNLVVLSVLTLSESSSWAQLSQRDMCLKDMETKRNEVLEGVRVKFQDPEQIKSEFKSELTQALELIEQFHVRLNSQYQVHTLSKPALEAAIIQVAQQLAKDYNVVICDYGIAHRGLEVDPDDCSVSTHYAKIFSPILQTEEDSGSHGPYVPSASIYIPSRNPLKLNVVSLVDIYRVRPQQFYDMADPRNRAKQYRQWMTELVDKFAPTYPISLPSYCDQYALTEFNPLVGLRQRLTSSIDGIIQDVQKFTTTAEGATQKVSQ